MWRLLAIIALCMLIGTADARPHIAVRLDRIERPPRSWLGPVFTPRFDFPVKAIAGTYPWQGISFRKEPERYLRAALTYALEGQDRVHWRLAANKVRRWYHVPWLGPGPSGREFIHGLTRARDFAPGELGPAQTACRQNWAVAFYNEEGGATLRKVWGVGNRAPNLSALPFKPGTLAVKIVFTEASKSDDPKLAGAPELLANIHTDASPDDTACPASTSNGNPGARTPRKLRLVQIDIAIREPRASYKTGWVFGSFRYDGTMAGGDPWAKLAPLGLMWGNDPDLSDAAAAAGELPLQSVVFPAGKGFGRGGRANGLVDERSSACSSCHMAAQWPSVAPMQAPADWAEAKCWFRNLDARYTFGFPPGTAKGCADPTALEKLWPLDFSLQLTIAVRNWALMNTAEGKRRQTPIGSLVRNGDSLTVDTYESLSLKR